MPMNGVKKNPVSTLITRRASYVKHSGLGIRIHVRVSCSITARKNVRLKIVVYYIGPCMQFPYSYTLRYSK